MESQLPLQTCAGRLLQPRTKGKHSSSLARGSLLPEQVFDWEAVAMAGLQGQEVSGVQEGERDQYGDNRAVQFQESQRNGKCCSGRSNPEDINWAAD